MTFWSRLFGAGTLEAITPNGNVATSVGEPGWSPGDPNGVEVVGEETFSRSLPFPSPSPWSGWPAEWGAASWASPDLDRLVDTAWACLDRNASILSAMPVYRISGGRVIAARAWMTNPDPAIYSSWAEFAKQLFWDYMLGEAFVLPMAHRADGFPMNFRVIPPWLINVEMASGKREYRLGGQDVTNEILHIRYKSSTVNARGAGPLEAAGARMTAARLLQRYVADIAGNGGTPPYVLTFPEKLEKAQADDLLAQWADSRRRNLGLPALLSGGIEAKEMRGPNPKDLALLELSQFTESRIAILLGVPPFLVGLPSGGDSLTYSNVSSLFDFHDRACLRPMANSVMSALSGWALPRGQAVELNRDEYVRPALLDRANAYQIMHQIGALTTEEIRAMERVHGEPSAVSLTGGDDA